MGVLNVDKKMEKSKEIVDALHHYTEQMEKTFNVVQGYTTIDLECRFSLVRTQETNLANYIADALLDHTHADVSILNSGTLRADRVIPKGPLTMGDILSLLPFADNVALVKVNICIFILYYLFLKCLLF